MKLADIIFLLNFIAFVRASPCPNGYTQAANGGDCFMVKSFFDDFSGQYFPKTFDEAEIYCNENGGGLLMSIHNEAENGLLGSLRCPNSGGINNIGLKCNGRDCNWDDGSPITYTNFADVPQDDGSHRCYGKSDHSSGWAEKSCGKQERDCFICRVKAKTIDCLEGETEYKGGCVSVHTTPLDQKSADSSCPGGGHLVSIHSGKENDRYKKIASDAGINGTIYIGGQYSKAVFYWSDGSYEGYSYWANWFPNLVLGTCVQMLLASEFGVQGQWASIDCTAKLPYMCYRDGAEFGPTVDIPGPKADPHCPSIQYFNNSNNGTIYSPNYPLSIPTQQTCEYDVTTNPNTSPDFKFNFYDCEAATTIDVYISPDYRTPYHTFGPGAKPPPTQWYDGGSSNFMKIVFTTTATNAPTGKGWELYYEGSW